MYAIQIQGLFRLYYLNNLLIIKDIQMLFTENKLLITTIIFIYKQIK